MLKQYLIRFINKIIKVTKITPYKKLPFFCVHIVEHCNLKCQYCDHFAPLAEEEFANIEIFEKDFARLSSLFNARVDGIGIMGGEPLLHPQLKDFLYIARKYFPKTTLHLITNGMLLLNQTNDFWKACRDNDILIAHTKYPIELDFDTIKEVARKNGVKYQYYDVRENGAKTSYYIPLDLKGNQNKYVNFIKCGHANYCCFLAQGGKLFTCTVAPNIRHFNKFFNKNISLTSADYIDIYKAKNSNEVMNFLCRPIPFCKFCYVNKRTFGHAWEKSKKDIKEWTV